MSEDHPILTLSNLDAGYGKKKVLVGISMTVQPAEVVAIIGPNGSGKSTTLKVVHGLIRPWQGDVRFCGQSLRASSSAARVAEGITFVPQGNRVFADLTVLENLALGGCRMPRGVVRSRIEAVLQFFPVLATRLEQMAGTLSGGEQQMVAIGRALVPEPRLLLLDEPSLGLSPDLVSQVFGMIVEINRSTGASILIVEQKVREVLKISSRVYSLKLGRVAHEGRANTLASDKARLKDLFL